jgi:hypothetical protein
MSYAGVAKKCGKQENRIFLGAGMIVFILYGLYNLQKREKFV